MRTTYHRKPSFPDRGRERNEYFADAPSESASQKEIGPTTVAESQTAGAARLETEIELMLRQVVQIGDLRSH